MRTIPVADLTMEAATARVRHLYVESADPEDMQERVQAVLDDLAAQPQQTWVLAFVDLTGAGDGHTFVTHLEVADSSDGDLDVEGVPVGAVKLLYYMAAQAAALTLARRALQSQIAALVTANGSQLLFQASLAGASQGTRFMGFVMLGPAPD